MSASFTVKQVPLGLLRQQSRVNPITKRFQTNAATQTQNPGYPLYPSVSQLLHQKSIPDSEISKIPATGPKGRLLKGDVLAYIGDIKAGYPAEQAALLAKMGHLDLSNIKIAPPPAPPAKEPAAETPAPSEEVIPKLPSDISIAVSVSLEPLLSTQKRIKSALGVTVPLSTFIARATEIANDDLPRKPAPKPSANELFDEILGAAPAIKKFTRGSYIPEINTVPLENAEEEFVEKEVKEEEDIIDILSGKVSHRPKFAPSGSVSSSSSKSSFPAAALNVFSLTVPVAEERRAKTFLDRLSTVLTVDPGRLVL